GYEGTAVFPLGGSGEWMSLIRFRTEPQLSAWLGSPQRKAVLPPVRSSLTQDFSVFAQTTPLGTTVRRVNGKTAMTPSWKTAMLLLMVLYRCVWVIFSDHCQALLLRGSFTTDCVDPVLASPLRASRK
ncbi:MAG TPA: hypothetical protein VML93_22110, partial [Mycobacterium sp.]|nr:hypothetical protein [Mycobacterium sp.]